MPSITFTITGAYQKKTGEKNGKQWILYEVTGREANGKPFVGSTFDSAYLNREGATVTVEYEVAQNGKFTNYRLGNLPKQETPAPPASSTPPPSSGAASVVATSQMDELLRLSRETNRRVSRLEAILSRMGNAAAE